MSSMTLTEFLLARIAEDEAVARPEFFDPDPDLDDPIEGPDTGWLNAAQLTQDCDLDVGTSEHIIRFSPTHVLAECEAKRQIIKNQPWRETSEGSEQQGIWTNDVAALAAIYADHPDYRDEWRP